MEPGQLGCGGEAPAHLGVLNDRKGGLFIPLSLFSHEVLDLVGLEALLIVSRLAELSQPMRETRKSNIIGLMRLIRLKDAESHVLKGEEMAEKQDWAGAKEQFAEAAAVYKQLEETARASNMLSALGLAQFALNELEEAMASLQEALRIKREIRDREGEATELLAIGNVHLAAKRYPEAERAYIGALAVFRMLDIIDGEIYVYRAMSRLYKEMGREEDAQRALDQVDEARVRLAKT